MRFGDYIFPGVPSDEFLKLYETSFRAVCRRIGLPEISPSPIFGNGVMPKRFEISLIPSDLDKQHREYLDKIDNLLRESVGSLMISPGYRGKDDVIEVISTPIRGPFFIHFEINSIKL